MRIGVHGVLFAHRIFGNSFEKRYVEFAYKKESVFAYYITKTNYKKRGDSRFFMRSKQFGRSIRKFNSGNRTKNERRKCKSKAPEVKCRPYYNNSKS